MCSIKNPGISAGLLYVFFFQAEDGIRYLTVTGVQTCALPIFVPGRPWLDREPVHQKRGRDVVGQVGDDFCRLAAQHRAGIEALRVGMHDLEPRTEEGRVGEEGGTRGWADHYKKKRKNTVARPE